jgi:hypothetical protein
MLALAAYLACSATALAQYTTPNTVTGTGPVSVTVGNTQFTNHGLQGVGRIEASKLDQFGDTLGSVSGLSIGNWARGAAGSYTGTFFTLPDRGYNAAPLFSDYAGRVQSLDFSFAPYTGAAPLGGTTLAEKLATQNQIKLQYKGGTKFSYTNGSGQSVTTTGLDPLPGVPGTTPLLGQSVPYVQAQAINGQPFPVNRLALDAEALVLKKDGSGYIGDEYGPNIYYFNSVKQIVAAIRLPEALRPYGAAAPVVPTSELNFNSSNPPLEGRRNNQGMEGVALSPDGKKLYALMQSATVQDSTSDQQTRLNTRMLVFDVGAPGPDGVPVHSLSEEYVLQLPTFRRNGNGGAVNRTAAQSEIVVLGGGKVLVLSRDGNGLGSNAPDPAMFKSVLLVDTQGATNLVGSAFDAKGAAVSPGGVLLASITPLNSAQALNMLNTTELVDKFNFNLNNAQVDRLTLSEKWEGMSLVSALDPSAANDYFLFIANDNDFLTQSGVMPLANGDKFLYDASVNYAPGLWADNDTVFLAYRVTISRVPEPATYAMLVTSLLALAWVSRRRRD